MFDNMIVMTNATTFLMSSFSTTLTNITNDTIIFQSVLERIKNYVCSNVFENSMRLVNKRSDCINTSQTAYDNCGSDEVLDSELQANYSLLTEFGELTDNWDECGAKAPSKTIILNMIYALPKLTKQPELFPTPDGTIQLEYSIGKNKHLNVEILSGSKMSIFEMFEDRTAKKEYCDYDITYLNERINKFYDVV